jgi:hypothetical protein
LVGLLSGTPAIIDCLVFVVLHDQLRGATTCVHLGVDDPSSLSFMISYGVLRPACICPVGAH